VPPGRRGVGARAQAHAARGDVNGDCGRDVLDFYALLFFLSEAALASGFSAALEQAFALAPHTRANLDMNRDGAFTRTDVTDAMDALF